jgi:metal-dependent amidase/aminoacylase/carboxypeptidase family protein
MASSDRHQITIKGQQTHGAVPWAGVDPIVTASQVVLGASDHRLATAGCHADAVDCDHRAS